MVVRAYMPRPQPAALVGLVAPLQVASEEQLDLVVTGALEEQERHLHGAVAVVAEAAVVAALTAPLEIMALVAEAEGAMARHTEGPANKA